MKDNKMEEEKNLTPEKKSNSSLVIWVCIIFFIAEVIIVSIAKANSKTFSTGAFIIWLAGGLVLFGGVALGFFLTNRKKSLIEKETEEKLSKFPKPITFEEVEKIVDKIFKHSKYSQYVSSPEEEGVESVGEYPSTSYVYHCVVQGVYKDKISGVRPKYGVIINMHYPDTLKMIVVDPTDAKMRSSINKLACAPIKAPDREIVRERNNLMGTERETERITHYKDEKKDENKKGENLT